MGQLEGKAVLITGAASGIGAATARCFVNEGAQVACVDINEQALKKHCAGLEAAGGAKALPLVCDISDPEAAGRSVAQAVEGLGKLDVLCNIAGIGWLKPDEQETPEGWNRIIAVTLSGAFYMSHQALPHLLRSRGTIINCASTAAHGIPWGAAYSAAKAGVCGLTRSMAITHAKEGLRVNCIAPGPTDTPIADQFTPDFPLDEELMHFMLPLGGQLASPEDMGRTFVMLALPQAKLINGVVLRVDQGARTC